mmetsp:Transcript_7663/g.10923  ORF Transcript_7663/g.10923 Transcript_7663/m.10923 type:complete len:389 (-) Transcript_7663:88-1254(-)
MDLLGGGSDDSDDDNSSMEDSSPSMMISKSITHKPTATTGTKMTTTTETKKQRIGKRIIGLEAVLPQNIRDRMAMIKTFDDSDSDDEQQPRKEQGSVATRNPTNTLGRGNDVELSGLLSELKQSKTTTPATTKKSLSNGNVSTIKSILQVETVEEDEDDDESPTLPSASLGIETHDLPQPNSNKNRITTASSSSLGIQRGGMSSVPAPTRNILSSTVPKPSRLPHQHHQQTHQAAMENNNSTHDDETTPAVAQPEEPATATTSNRNQRKRSRQRMEQALRSGNLDVLDHGQHSHSGTVVTLGDDYQEGTTTFTLDNAQDSQPQQQQYNFPKVDTDTIDIKAKGKHQINQLLAQAAQLERRRAEQSSIMGGGHGTGNSKRSGSKQKYGW